MRRKFPVWAEAILLLVLLVPSAVFAWENLDMPQFGFQHDDTIYYVTAKALATGEGYRIISLPGQPWQTKYPPLFPAFLAIVWRIVPEFPENLKVATVLCWLMLPPLLWLIRLVYRRYNFPAWWAWTMVAVLAINPYVRLLGVSLLSEVLFTLLLVSVFVVAPRSTVWAGVLAGLAYLTRTAALPLVVAVPAVYLMRREFRKASLFFAVMAPFLVGWAVWTSAHMMKSDDAYLLYYIDYIGYRKFIVTISNLPLIVWSNIDGLLNSMASVIMPFSDSAMTKVLVQTIGVGVIVGVYRLARDRAEARAYAIYGILSSAMLVAWHYPRLRVFYFRYFRSCWRGSPISLRRRFRLFARLTPIPRKGAPRLRLRLCCSCLPFR